ncbi:oxygen-independent coproporphyrinogen III oxidase [Parasulfitobacter algicola]|uniref:Coproporphyrinogen-III oxidase n=1 Tax=Parasulfitobacter algicola TaxID=2614809 RepID=A0ABX2IVL3_9RHOB|nr:oxygen-independent coproporphyrinogen III oxidase [Sulfitobacter algicola]NSX54877.1 oxygen-independent coproporphyrinogen III oxidase [Sulfitobacter algicola]
MNTMTQLRQLGLFDAKVPRYTSYPTAPHFADTVGTREFSGWIDEIPQGGQISLYLHVPFCRRLCWFCACRTQGTQSTAPVQAYLQTLKSELALLKRRLPKGVSLARLHWGGGTPTLLSADMMRDLAESIFTVAPLASDAEFSVEIDPNEIDADRIKALAAIGMNRASIGVQDFDPDIQKTIGRQQSYDVTRDAADALRAVGIRSLNADILYGLPHQTPHKIAESVQMLLSLSPDRVALYGYAHVPWMARRQGMIPSDALPTPEERLELFETASQLFAWDDYAEIGIDHFAKYDDGLTIAQRAGRLRRNFQGYTDDPSDVLISLGASAISRFPQGFAQNASSTSAYTAAVRAEQFATVRGHNFSPDDKLRGRIIEALMCDFHVQTAELVNSFGVTAKQIELLYQKALGQFPGMLSITKDGLQIPTKSRALTRMIARSFDVYSVDQAGHSHAI